MLQKQFTFSIEVRFMTVPAHRVILSPSDSSSWQTEEPPSLNREPIIVMAALS